MAKASPESGNVRPRSEQQGRTAPLNRAGVHQALHRTVLGRNAGGSTVFASPGVGTIPAGAPPIARPRPQRPDVLRPPRPATPEEVTQETRGNIGKTMGILSITILAVAAAGIGAKAVLSSGSNTADRGAVTTPDTTQRGPAQATEHPELAALRAKLEALAQNMRTIDPRALEIAMLYNDIYGSGFDGEDMTTAQARRRHAESMIIQHRLNEYSEATTTVNGRVRKLPTSHNLLQWREPRPIQMKDGSTRMGRMFFVISFTRLLEDENNPFGLKIALPVGSDPEGARKRFEAAVNGS